MRNGIAIQKNITFGNGFSAFATVKLSNWNLFSFPRPTVCTGHDKTANAREHHVQPEVIQIMKHAASTICHYNI